MNNDNLAAQHCKQCGKPLHGRIDKMYCDYQCRNTFNNKMKRGKEQYITEINRKLRRNRRILKTLCPVGKSTVRKEIMEAMGYDFSTFSTVFKSAKGSVYYLCYEYGFAPIVQEGKQKALIIAKQDYMTPWEPWETIKKK